MVTYDIPTGIIKTVLSEHHPIKINVTSHSALHLAITVTDLTIG